MVDGKCGSQCCEELCEMEDSSLRCFRPFEPSAGTNVELARNLGRNTHLIALGDRRCHIGKLARRGLRDKDADRTNVSTEIHATLLDSGGVAVHSPVGFLPQRSLFLPPRPKFLARRSLGPIVSAVSGRGDS